MTDATAPTAATPVAYTPDSRERPEDQTLRPTRNSLSWETRVQVVGLFNQRLADCVDLHTQCKQAHWNVRGPHFVGLHRLFDEIAADVGAYADLVAERVVQLGGTAEGTARVVAVRSTLADYPLAIHVGEEHVAALADALAAFGRAVRMGVEEMTALQDGDSADILTEVSRGADKWLWMVEAHLPPAR